VSTKIKGSVKPAEIKNTLNTKQSLFSQYFNDINQLDKEGKHTLGNMTRSYMLAYNSSSVNVAASGGSILMRNPKIVTEFERLAQECGAGSKVRMNALTSILTGSYQQKTVKKHYHYVTDATGKRRKQIVDIAEETKTPTAREVSQAVDVIEKTAVLHKAAGLSTLTQLSEQAKQVLSTMKDVTPHEDDSTLLMIAEAEIEQEEGGKGGI